MLQGSKIQNIAAAVHDTLLRQVTHTGDTLRRMSARAFRREDGALCPRVFAGLGRALGGVFPKTFPRGARFASFAVVACRALSSPLTLANRGFSSDNAVARCATHQLKMVGTERFELSTSCSRSKRSTRLSYVPSSESTGGTGGAVNGWERVGWCKQNLEGSFGPDFWPQTPRFRGISRPRSRPSSSSSGLL